MDPLGEALREAGGLAAPREASAQLRVLLTSELTRSVAELAERRSGYPDPVTVAIGADAEWPRALRVVLPVDADLRADLALVEPRSWTLTAAAIGALVEAGATGTPEAGALDGRLALRMPLAPGSTAPDPELAVLALEDQLRGVDRLRARALAVPVAVLEDACDFRTPLDTHHPLLVAAHLAGLGARPADPAAADAHETALATLLGPATSSPQRPHEDPDPARRSARRILQRLDGMGKWGGYHTEFTHLARGFPPAERALAATVGEELLKAGLLCEKLSVGQRHVHLNSRRVGEIRAVIDDGKLPAGLDLPAT